MGLIGPKQYSRRTAVRGSHVKMTGHWLNNIDYQSINRMIDQPSGRPIRPRSTGHMPPYRGESISVAHLLSRFDVVGGRRLPYCS